MRISILLILILVVLIACGIASAQEFIMYKAGVEIVDDFYWADSLSGEKVKIEYIIPTDTLLVIGGIKEMFDQVCEIGTECSVTGWDEKGKKKTKKYFGAMPKPKNKNKKWEKDKEKDK